MRALASHKCGAGSIPPCCHMWVWLVVGPRPCFEGFSWGTPVFPPSTKANISKFQFDQDDICLEDLHEPAKSHVASSLKDCKFKLYVVL